MGTGKAEQGAPLLPAGPASDRRLPAAPSLPPVAASCAGSGGEEDCVFLGSKGPSQRKAAGGLDSSGCYTETNAGGFTPHRPRWAAPPMAPL